MSAKKSAEPSPESIARSNRQRLAAEEGAQAMVDVEKQAVDVRKNMARLRELRQAKEAADATLQASLPAAHPDEAQEEAAAIAAFDIAPTNVWRGPVTCQRVRVVPRIKPDGGGTITFFLALGAGRQMCRLATTFRRRSRPSAIFRNTGRSSSVSRGRGWLRGSSKTGSSCSRCCRQGTDFDAGPCATFDRPDVRSLP